MKRGLQDRLLSKVIIDTSTGCWVWLGCKRKEGYGRISVKGRSEATHRMSYTLFNGTIPKGLLVCHKCDNPSCINPEHLFVGTDLDNSKDKIKKGRQFVLKGENVSNSILTNTKVMQIRSLCKDGLTLKEISEMFGVSITTIHRVKIRKTWKHI